MPVNNYVRPTATPTPNVHLTTPPDEYDLNFMFPVKNLRSDRVELRPFVPALHAQALLDGAVANPELLKYIGLKAPFATLDDVCQWQENTSRASPTTCRFAIYSAPLDRLDAPVEEYVFAGTITYLESSYENMCSEIGWIVILTPFQRTHVLTHAAGLTIKYLLDAPEDGGLGLRRCQWKANALNAKSAAAAKRLGFTFEGVLRSVVVLPPGNPGSHEGRPGVRNADCPSRDTWMSSITWYEWENGVRNHIEQLMARRA